MADTEEKVALISGAARRVGAVIAKRLHDHGMNIVVHYRSSREAAEALRESLVATRPGSVEIVGGDLLEAGVPERVVENASNRWGRLDVLVNNASAFYPTRIGRVSHEQWNELIGTNLEVPFFLSQAAAPHLAEARGSIVNLVDIYAERPLKGFSVYSIAKAGLVAMTKSLARELGPEVRVNAVAPGAILWPDEGTSETSQRKIIAKTALGRKGEPEDVAGAVAFLVEGTEYVTGHVLTVDGGRSVTP